jgi:hypothetical protein
MKTKIRIHKNINNLPILLEKEFVVNIFFNLIEKFNKQETYTSLELTKQDLWDLSGFKRRFNEEDFSELIKTLTKPTIFQNKNERIWGSIFSAKEENEIIKIYVSEPYRPYLFYKRDIDLMHKAKHKKVLSVAELEYYDKEVKPKSKFLVLLHKADLLGLKGKYNKRLYALLKQFDSTGVYWKNWKDFKEILEIPDSYRTSEIDRSILNKAKKELLKVGIEITEIKKIKKGRSIDRVEIRFKCEETLPSDSFSQSKETEESKEGQELEMSKVKRKALSELARKGKFHLIEPLMKLRSDEEVEEFMEEI